jgi:Xaa-Pro dipeptidase
VKGPSGRAARLGRAAARLAGDGIAAALFEDAEGRRDSSVRYLSGQPGDALLVLASDGRAALVAWDLNLARLEAEADEILAYADFERRPTRALEGALSLLGVAPGSRVELPSTFSYLRYVELVERLPGYDFVCREDGVDRTVAALRAVKDAGEVELYREAGAITDRLIDGLEARVRSGEIGVELDAALYIERESRELGCEGPGFETLAAGPGRSWGIHAFPPYGRGPFAAEGMSILDFGVRLRGYTTDVTMGFLRGELGAEREAMVALVERAHREALAMVAPGVLCRDLARRADAIFAEASLAMPHALGHGVGLDAHEAPAIRSRDDCEDLLEPGMVVTIEPGLYHPRLGGIRLEDTVLVTGSGGEKLTNSRIVRL